MRRSKLCRAQTHLKLDVEAGRTQKETRRTVAAVVLAAIMQYNIQQPPSLIRTVV